jgi:two-component system OmpR family response regulator
MDEDIVHFEGWTLHVSSRQLSTPSGMIVPLSNAEFRLLWTFIQRPRRVLTRDQLMDAARGQASTAFDRSIDLLVSRLRQKLDEDPRDPRLLKTIRGEGYLFDARIAR